MWESNISRREQMRRDIQRKISQINMERREMELPHNPYDQENGSSRASSRETARRSEGRWQRRGRGR